ncbi:MAG: TolC family protein [Opitutaceae bacterium]
MALAAPAAYAQEVSRAAAPPKLWRRWLSSIAPKSPALPEVPSPLREPARVWTRNESLARALQANPDVQVALVTVQRQDAVRLSSISSLLPHIGITASSDWRADSLIDRSARELAEENLGAKLTPISTRGYNYQLQVSQNVFDGLASWHQVKRMALLQKKASVDARELYLRIASQIRQAYDATLLRQTMVVTRRDAVSDLARLADVAKKRNAAGSIAQWESQRAESVLRSAEADLAQAEAELARAQEAFCRMIYIEKPAGGLQLAGTIEPLEYREDFEVAFQRAQAGRLDLRSAQLQLDAADMALRVAAGAWWPRIEAVASYGVRSSYYDVQRENKGWSFGLSGRFDIFSGGQDVATRRVHRADRRIAEIRLAEVRRLIPSQIRELMVALDGSRKVMAANISARDLAERSVREANKLFEQGSISSEVALNSEMAFRQARLNLLNAVYSNNVIIYQLDYITANESFLDAVAPAPR